MIHALIVLATLASATGEQVVDARPQQAPGEPQASLALVTKYAFGLASFHLVGTRPGSIWAPMHRIARWKTPDGTLPVAVLQLAWQRVDDNVRVTVSVLRGSPHQQEDVVKTVLLRRGDHVVIKELSAVGLEPMELSLADAAPLTPFLPSVVSITPDIEINTVDLLSGALPGYRVTVRNLSSKAIANFHFQSYHGDKKAVSAVPRGPGGRPAMRPGDSFSFQVLLSSGQVDRNDQRPLSPIPVDVIEIDSVLFEDGTIVGDAKLMASSKTTAATTVRRLQLERAIDVLRKIETAGGSAAELLVRAAEGLEALPESDESLLPEGQASLRETRAMTIDDLRRLESAVGGDAEMARAGLRQMIQRYGDWIRRLSI